MVKTMRELEKECEARSASMDKDAAHELTKVMCAAVMKEINTRRPVAFLPPYWVFEVCARAALAN